MEWENKYAHKPNACVIFRRWRVSLCVLVRAKWAPPPQLQPLASCNVRALSWFMVLQGTAVSGRHVYAPSIFHHWGELLSLLTYTGRHTNMHPPHTHTNMGLQTLLVRKPAVHWHLYIISDVFQSPNINLHPQMLYQIQIHSSKICW